MVFSSNILYVGNDLFAPATPPPFAWQPNPAHDWKREAAEVAWAAIYHEIAHAEAAQRLGVHFSGFRIGKNRLSHPLEHAFSGNLAHDLEVAAAGAACTIVLTDGRIDWDRERAMNSGLVDRNALWDHHKASCGQTEEDFMADFRAEVDKLVTKLRGDAALRGQYDAWAKQIGDEFWDRLETPYEGHVDFEWPSLVVSGSEP